MKKKLTPIKAMRKFCIDCVETFQEVMLCTDPDCTLYPYRFGHREGNAKSKDVVYIKGSTDRYLVGGKEMQWVNEQGWKKPEKSYKDNEVSETPKRPK